MPLSPAQQRAQDLCAAGNNVLVTGPGGSGKTHLIRCIVEATKATGKEVQVCALTGCAAVLLECGARTVHSWAGIGLASGDPEIVIDRVCRNKFKKLPWTKLDLLIIDEISMMSKKLFDILDAIGRRARRRPHLPFGGLRVLFSGDFYQLPPVGDQGQPDSSAFCFESDAWDAAFPEIVELRTIYRQSDSAYIKVLNQIRRGRLSTNSYALLQARVRDPPDQGIVATQLVPRRREADAINREAMRHLAGEPQMYTLRRAKDMALSKVETNSLAATSKAAQEAEVAHLRANVMVGDRLELKIGAQVM
jgi:ATP-dependent DNA helicase PIF1